MTDRFQNTYIASTPIKDTTSIPQSSVDSNTSGITESITGSYTHQNTKNPQNARSKFRAFGGSHNPCPVCGRTHDSDCRYSVNDPDYVLCHSYCDSRKGERINGYICVSEANGHTAGFKPDRSEKWDEDAKARYLAKKEAASLEKAERSQRDKESRIARELPVDQRDFHYRRLLNSQRLHMGHEELLLQRGFSLENIKKFGFRSIKSDAYVGDDYPANLAGLYENKIAAKGDGLAFPIPDVDGNIVAIWYHPDEIKNGGKYKPLSSPNNSIHVQGEIPIAYYPGSGNDKRNFLIESHGFKDKLANAKHNINTVGGSGGLHWNSPELLKATLTKIANPGDTIILTPDGGDVQTKQGAEKWIKNAKAVTDLGYKPVIAWWGQYKKKENPDIDELDDLSSVEFITVEQFQEIHKDEYERYLAERKTADNLKKFFTMSAFWRKSREFTATYEVEMKDFAFPSWIKFKQVIISVRSGLGSNKTGAVLALIKRLGMGAIIVGYRNNLLYQTCARGEEFELGFYHISEEGAHQMICDDFSNLALCLDSIKYVDGYFGGKILVLDETCSVLLHALGAGTLGKDQAKAIAQLTRAIKDAEVVLLLDGNLANIHTDFISKLCTEKQLIKIENTQKIAPHNITFVSGIDAEDEIKKNDKSAMIRQMSSENCISWTATDSKRNAIILDKILKDSGKRGYALHGDSVAEDWAKEFLKDPDTFIAKHKPDYIIISPTAESGVSVTINGHFTHKFSFFCGVLGTNSQHQMMFRLRDNTIPHFVFCPEVSIVADRSVPQTYITNHLQKVLEERILQSAINAGEKAANYYGKALARQHDDWWELSCLLSTLDNFEMNNLKWCLMFALEDAGHNVDTVEWLNDDEMNLQVKEARKFVNQKEAKELFVSDIFPDTESAHKASKKNPNLQVRRKIDKTFLLERLPQIEESEIWNEEFILKCVVETNKNFIKQQERYWLLNNYEFSEKHHEVNWSYESTADFFFNGRVANMQHDRIKALKELEILRLEGMEYHKDSPIILEILQKLRESRELRVALNQKIWKETTDGKERLDIIRKLLGIVGLKNQSTSKKTLPNGTRIIHYKCVPIGTLSKDSEDAYDFLAARKAILEAIERKQQSWIESEKALPVWEEELKKELYEEWTQAAKNELEAIWLKEEAVTDVADTLKLIEDFEQYKMAIIDCGVPEFATKAALSTLTEQELNRLCEFGVVRVPLGSFETWCF